MSTRYKIEVVERARKLAGEATAIHELDRPTEHPTGECVDCDAVRLISTITAVEPTTLHRLRRVLAGYGADPDTLDLFS